MRYLAIDTETTLFPPQGSDKVNTRHHIPDLIVTTWSMSEDGGGWEGWPPEGLMMWDDTEGHRRLFDQPDDVMFVFHNVAFDLGVITKQYPDLRWTIEKLVLDGRILDTRVLYLLRDPDPLHKAISLAYLSQKILNEPMEKGAVRTSFRRDMVLSEEQREYAIKDAVVTRKIAETLRSLPLGCYRNHWGAVPPNKLIASHPNTKMDHPDIAYSRAAGLMSWYLVPQGMELDPAKLKEFHADYEARVGRLQAGLVECGFARLERARCVTAHVVEVEDTDNWGRRWERWTVVPPTMRRCWRGVVEEVQAKVVMNTGVLRASFEAFANDIGIEPPRSGKQMRVSMKRDDWKDYTVSMPSNLQLFMDYQRYSKHLTAYLRPLVESRGTEVKPNYWVPGAATGRWACSKPGLQQVPKKLRSMYRSRKGKLFVLADYPTLELYTLAHVMDCMGIEGPLMAALVSGDDIHTRTAALMYAKDQKTITSDERQSAKAANFGLPGGMGVKRFWVQAKLMGLDWQRNHAYKIRNLWFAAYPDIRQYLNCFEVNAYQTLCPPGMEKREWLQRLGFDPDETWPSNFELTKKINDGKIYTVVLPTGRTIPDRGYSAAANCFFQGTGADVITEAFSRVCESGLNPVAVVHDSITCEVDEHLAATEGSLLCRIMADALQVVCPSVPRPTVSFEISKEWK